MRRAIAMAALALLGACRGCGGEPAAPDEHAVRRLADPYESAPAKGSVSDTERAVAIIDAVAKDLGYGSRPAELMRARAGEAWMRRTIMFLDHGGPKQVHAAWVDVLTSIVQAYRVPPEVKVLLRQGQARILDLERAKPPEAELRKAELAEIAWAFYVLGGAPVVGDAGP